METSTIELLKSYDPDITELDISGEAITPTINGILDLSRFVSLKELNCSLNYITSIINFPSTLEILNCNSNMYIESLDNLPVNLIQLDCKTNNISLLDNLPQSLQILNCSYNHIESLDKLPGNLIKLNCSNDHGNLTSLDNLPEK